MSQILLTQEPASMTFDETLDVPLENIPWLGQGNKYIENQWTIIKNWDKLEMKEKDNFDQSFISEYSFICQNI